MISVVNVKEHDRWVSTIHINGVKTEIRRPNKFLLYRAIDKFLKGKI